MHELPTCQDVEVKQTLITALEHLIVSFLFQVERCRETNMILILGIS